MSEKSCKACGGYAGLCLQCQADFDQALHVVQANAEHFVALGVASATRKDTPFDLILKAARHFDRIGWPEDKEPVEWLRQGIKELWGVEV